MLTPEDIEMTKKYLHEYDGYCASTECGMDCPVFREHQTNKKDSCFRIYCQLRESGVLKPPSK